MQEQGSLGAKVMKILLLFPLNGEATKSLELWD